MAKKCKHGVDEGKYAGTIFMGLSKAIDTLNHNFFACQTKYFSFNAIKFVQVICRNDFKG